MSSEHKLYAFPHSLYSGRARSYLIKAKIPFREYSTGHESYKAKVLPRAGLPTIPVIVTPSEEVIRDGAKIIEHFEKEGGMPFTPITPKQKIISALFDLIGSDGLLRPAMHYRWNYLSENESFSHYHFLHCQRLTETREEKTNHMMGRMKTVAGLWGVQPDTVDLIESIYRELLQLLDAHFSEVPYLLGWQPCIGDFGLIAPLYAHLGRDPAPARLMQQNAVRVYRWVERMNRADQDAPEFFHSGEGFLKNDDIPVTLKAVLKHLAEDLVPETVAACQVINEWLEHQQPEAGTPVERFMQKATFEVRGQTIESVSQPYRFMMLQRVHDYFDGLDEDKKSEVFELFASCNLSDLLETRLSRNIGWQNNLEVWL